MPKKRPAEAANSKKADQAQAKPQAGPCHEISPWMMIDADEKIFNEQLIIMGA
jgi:hypothetical protein